MTKYRRMIFTRRKSIDPWVLAIAVVAVVLMAVKIKWHI